MKKRVKQRFGKVAGLAIIVLVFILSGCGKKGDLYLPVENPEVSSTPAAGATPETAPKTQDEKKQEKPAE